MAERNGFLSRWSQRKALARHGAELPPEPGPQASPPATAVQVEACLDESSSKPGPHQAPGPLAAAPARPDEGSGPAAVPAEPPSAAETTPKTAAEPPPTLAEAQALTPASDFTRFVARDVDPQVRNTALKQLFRDPHFNVMDGLDTYIDDYGRPDPLPLSMLRKMTQAHALGLFADEPAAPVDSPPQLAAGPADRLNELGTEVAPEIATDPATPTTIETHEDADLRLQPHDAAGRSGPEPGAEPDTGRAG